MLDILDTAGQEEYAVGYFLIFNLFSRMLKQLHFSSFYLQIERR